MRYQGQGHEIEVSLAPDEPPEQAFEAMFRGWLRAYEWALDKVLPTLVEKEQCH
jgi:hypothetical protein